MIELENIEEFRKILKGMHFTEKETENIIKLFNEKNYKGKVEIAWKKH